jgi:hypothetical protein
MSPEPGDLIEDLDIDNLDHAEKFLLAQTSLVDGTTVGFICGNGNRYPFPKNGINHGPVMVAYRNLLRKIIQLETK